MKKVFVKVFVFTSILAAMALAQDYGEYAVCIDTLAGVPACGYAEDEAINEGVVYSGGGCSLFRRHNTNSYTVQEAEMKTAVRVAK